MGTGCISGVYPTPISKSSGLPRGEFRRHPVEPTIRIPLHGIGASNTRTYAQLSSPTVRRIMRRTSIRPAHPAEIICTDHVDQISDSDDMSVTESAIEYPHSNMNCLSVFIPA